MNHSELDALNFGPDGILHYGGAPAPIQNHYTVPIPCTGYCVNCERAGLLDNTKTTFTLMSHGCHSSAYEAEKVIGPMPLHPNPVEAPVLFLVQNPGGDKGTNKEVPYTVGGKDYNKLVPVHHYYWTPENERWPTCLEDFKDHYSGAYFAYLMNIHGLRNVYTTNAVKCLWSKDDTSAGRDIQKTITKKCIDTRLALELEEFKPQIVFCMGNDAHAWYKRYVSRPKLYTGAIVCKLYHFAFIRDRAQTQHMTPQQAVDINDGWITYALAQWRQRQRAA